jgi:hypothetical protein
LHVIFSFSSCHHLLFFQTLASVTKKALEEQEAKRSKKAEKKAEKK